MSGVLELWYGRRRITLEKSLSPWPSKDLLLVKIDKPNERCQLRVVQ